MDLKRNIAMILCISTILSVSSCGMAKQEEESSGKSFTHKSEDSVSVGYIVLKNDEKAVDLYDKIDGNVIVKMFNGDMITVYSIGSEWAKINYGGKDGYVKLESISFSEPEKKEEAEIKADETKIEADNNETSERQVSVEVEHIATEVSEDESRSESQPIQEKIEINNNNTIEIVYLTDRDGFQVADPIQSYPRYVPESTYIDGYCNTYAVYIYSIPDVNSVKRETDMLYSGDPVKILGSVNDWYYISTDNGSNGELHGYVSQSYITIGKNEVQKINYNATQGQVKDGMTAWVNYTPSKTDNIETLSGGTTFTIIGNANDYWYQISYYDGKTGWISYKMVDVW
ncbi:MAG: SH3 domain-containing protein [Clostridia bacterium]|nr:SH3 domain-containing protein [Clostridia bacterium]